QHLPLDIADGKRRDHGPALELVEEAAAARLFTRLEGLEVIALRGFALVLLHEDLDQQVIEVLPARQVSGPQLRALRADAQLLDEFQALLGEPPRRDGVTPLDFGPGHAEIGPGHDREMLRTRDRERLPEGLESLIEAFHAAQRPAESGPSGRSRRQVALRLE